MKSAGQRGSLGFLGLVCCIGVSNIYFNQSLLFEMGHTFNAAAGETGYVSGATQVGYAMGLLTLVPLGDVLERRALMMRLFAVVAVASVLVAISPTLMLLIASSVLLGVAAAVTHVALPIAPELVSHEERGRAIGVVMSGVLVGILLARSFAGWISTASNNMHFGIASLEGWRVVYLVAAVVNTMMVLFIWRMMPKLPPTERLSYAESMRSLWVLVKTQPLLRESSLLGALVFASFNCFWVTLAFLLGSHYHMGAVVAGNFGVLGATGALVAPIAGRLSDKRGSRYVITLGVVLVALAFLVLWTGATYMLGLIVGVVLLDAGAQACQLANQTRIFGLVPTARSRLNTVYMTVYFSGAAAGSALATLAWTHYHWTGVCVLGLILILLAGLRHLTGIRDSGSVPVPASVDEAVLEG